MATDTSQAEYAGSIPVIGSTTPRVRVAPASFVRPATPHRRVPSSDSHERANDCQAVMQTLGQDIINRIDGQ
jgi:hypothetical protein